jgi:hypothetical protein
METSYTLGETDDRDGRDDRDDRSDPGCLARQRVIAAAKTRTNKTGKRRERHRSSKTLRGMEKASLPTGRMDVSPMRHVAFGSDRDLTPKF